MNRYEQELCKIIQVIFYAHGCPPPPLPLLEFYSLRLQEILSVVINTSGPPDSWRSQQAIEAFRLLDLYDIPRTQHPSLPIRHMANIERAFDLLGLLTSDFVPRSLSECDLQTHPLADQPPPQVQPVDFPGAKFVSAIANQLRLLHATEYQLELQQLPPMQLVPDPSPNLEPAEIMKHLHQHGRPIVQQIIEMDNTYKADLQQMLPDLWSQKMQQTEKDSVRHIDVC